MKIIILLLKNKFRVLI